MNRRHSLIGAAILAMAAVAYPPLASAQSNSEVVTIVLPINMAGTSREASISALRAVQAVVRKQPGLIDEVLEENRNPEIKPEFVHVTRWRAQRFWEDMFTSPEMQKVIRDNLDKLQGIDAARIYTPIQ